MKQLFAVLTLIVAPAWTWARPLNSPSAALAVKAEMEQALFSLPGVNGVGLGGCNPKTGHEQPEKDFVYCVTISTESEEAYQLLTGLYPEPTRVRGVSIVIRKIGPITPQPRMSVGG